MGMIADLFVKLGLKSEGFNQGLDSAQKKVTNFGSVIGRVGQAIIGAFAVDQIIGFGKTSLEEFNKSEQGAMRLLVALKGNTQAQKELISQSEKLAGITLFEDDETIAAQAAMAVMIKDADVIKQLIPLVQDLATAKGIDLSSAATAVGKAVEGSGAALQKMGIEITGTAGSAERLKSVIDGLNRAVGGQAAEAAKVGTGALTQMSNAYGNLKEAIGGVIANSGLFQYTVSSFKQYFEDQTAMINTKTIPAWQKLFNIITGNVKGFAEQEKVQKETAEYWNKILHGNDNKEKTTIKFYTDTEQVQIRIDELKKKIADAKIELSKINPKSDDWKTSSDALKSLQDELESFTGSQKVAEEQAKKETEAQSHLTDILILQAKERQHINDLIGVQSKGTLSGKTGSFGTKTGVKEGWTTTGEMGNYQVPAITPPSLAPLDNFYKQLADRTKKAKEEFAQLDKELNDEIVNGMMNAYASLSQGIADLAFGNISGAEFGKGILQMIGNFMVQLGLLMVTTSELFTKWKTSLATGGWGSIGLGLALIAAGAAVSSYANKGPTSSNATSSQSVASGAGGLNFQGNQGGKYEFIIKGTNLVGVLQNTGTAKSIMR